MVTKKCTILAVIVISAVINAILSGALIFFVYDDWIMLYFAKYFSFMTLAVKGITFIELCFACAVFLISTFTVCDMNRVILIVLECAIFLNIVTSAATIWNGYCSGPIIIDQLADIYLQMVVGDLHIEFETAMKCCDWEFATARCETSNLPTCLTVAENDMLDNGVLEGRLAALTLVTQLFAFAFVLFTLMCFRAFDWDREFRKDNIENEEE